MKRVLGEFDFFWEINFANGDVTICKTDVVAQPEFFFGDFENPLDFFGLFHRANSYDHCPEIKFQRICPKIH